MNRDKIIDGRPWCFDNKLLVLQEIAKEVQPSEMILNFSRFRIRFYNLSFGIRLDAKITAVASVVGEVMEIAEDFLDINQYSRVRVCMDVTKPLKRS